MTLFHSWLELLRTATAAVIVFIFIIVVVHLLGKRSTSKMNNFDWLVTIALGSMLGSTILLDKIVVINGIVGVSMLLILQYMVTKLAVYSDRFSHLVHATPALLLYEGIALKATMRNERVTEGELLSAIRSKGFSNLAQVKAVVLESNAEISVIGYADPSHTGALVDVGGINDAEAACRRAEPTKHVG